MNHQEIRDNVGNRVLINGCGDLMMDGQIKRSKIICNTEKDIRINKLTKGGLVMLEVDGKLFNCPIPPRNIDPYEIPNVRHLECPIQNILPE